MALETNSNIATPYVYTPADFGAKIDAVEAKKDAAKKAYDKAAKELKARNAAALKFKPKYTSKEVLNNAVMNKYNNMLEGYSQLAATGVDISSASTEEGAMFYNDLSDLDRFSNEMSGFEKDMEEIESVKGADPDAYTYFTEKIVAAKEPNDVRNLIVEYRANKDLLAKAPDNRLIVKTTVEATAKNAIAEGLKKIGNGMTEIPFEEFIAPDKLSLIVEDIKNSEESQLEEKLFDFKSTNNIKDDQFLNPATGQKYDTYDEYLTDKAKARMELEARNYPQIKGSWNISITNKTGNTNKTKTGNLVTYTTGNSQVQASYIGKDPSEYINENGKHYTKIDIDPAVMANAKLSGSGIMMKNGSAYINIDELYKFEDTTNPAAVQSIDWVWTAKQNEKGLNAWKPNDGNYTTTEGGTVSGYPVKVLWDQAGNAWAAIKGSGGSITPVMIYPNDANAYGGASGAVQLKSKQNAAQLLTTFADNGLVDPSELSDPFVAIFNNFDKVDGYQGNGVR